MADFTVIENYASGMNQTSKMLRTKDMYLVTFLSALNSFFYPSLGARPDE